MVIIVCSSCGKGNYRAVSDYRCTSCSHGVDSVLDIARELDPGETLAVVGGNLAVVQRDEQS